MRAMPSMRLGGNTDEDVATMRRVRHPQALDMARVQVEHGESPVPEALARTTMAAPAGPPLSPAAGSPGAAAARW